MAIFTPAFSKFTLTQGTTQQIYMCPADKTHAYVDLSFFKNANPGTSLISIGISTESNPANLTSLDFFLDDIELIDTANVVSLEKVLVGANERVYAKLVSGEDTNIRLVAFEENNSKVQKAGKLAALAVPNTNINMLFQNTFSNIAYINTSITIYNPSSSNNAEIELWISSSANPTDADKISKFTITTQDSTVIENINISPNENIFVRSDILNTEFFVNGVIVKS